MKSKLFYRLIVSGVLIVVLAGVGILGIAIVSSSQPQSMKSLSQPSVATAIANTPTIPASPTLPAVASPISTRQVPPTLNVLASTTRAVTPASPLIINNPTNIAVGQVIKLPDQLYSGAGGITLRRTDKSPNLTVDEALDYNAGAPWEKGGLWNGDQITVTVTFGSGSLGFLHADGSWRSSFNPPEFTCTAVRKCTPTGKSLQRIENHPMWVIDYDGLKYCGTGPCDSHSVLLINDDGGTVYYSFGYTPS